MSDPNATQPIYDGMAGLRESPPSEMGPKTNYEALEREHFGDPDKRTGIYHPDNQRASAAPADTGKEGIAVAVAAPSGQSEAHPIRLSDGYPLARAFHDAYERLAPQYGYETRPETRTFDPFSPNGKLMIAVCAEMLSLIRRADMLDKEPGPEAAPSAIEAQKLVPFGWVCWDDMNALHKHGQCTIYQEAQKRYLGPSWSQYRVYIDPVSTIDSNGVTTAPTKAALPEERDIGRSVCQKDVCTHPRCGCPETE